MWTLQSLVLVSRLPYTHLFHSLLQIIAPEFFEKLEPCLETGDDITAVSQSGRTCANTHFVLAVCNEIDQWHPPTPGQTLNLPVMGVMLQVGRKGRGLQVGTVCDLPSCLLKGELTCDWLLFQVRIPSRTDKAGGSPLRQTPTQVRARWVTWAQF